MEERLLDLVEHTLGVGLPWEQNKYSPRELKVESNGLTLSFTKDYESQGPFYSLRLTRDYETQMSLYVSRRDGELFDQVKSAHDRVLLSRFPAGKHLNDLLGSWEIPPLEGEIVSDSLWEAVEALAKVKSGVWDKDDQYGFSTRFRSGDSTDRLYHHLAIRRFHHPTDPPPEEVDGPSGPRDPREQLRVSFAVEHVTLLESQVHEDHPRWEELTAHWDKIKLHWECEMTEVLGEFLSGAGPAEEEPVKAPEESSPKGFWTLLGLGK